MLLQIQDAPVAEKPAGWNSDCWATPWDVVHRLELEFGVFDLDPCCRRETAKAARFYTPEDDGLIQQWAGRVFCNPPYSDPRPWIEKAARSAKDGCLVVMLLPSKTDTAWFHDLILGKAEVRFCRGRIKFLGWKGTPINSPKDGSMFVIFRPNA